ncbi:MAG TPA: cation-translocating P-type ATPase [Anaerolineae bacterium]
MVAANFDESLREPVWHSLSVEEATRQLNTHLTKGLTQGEVEERRKVFGFNELQEEPRPTFWHRLWNQLNDFLVLILIVASVISLMLGDYTEAAAIMAIVVLNAILGVVQESRAEEALAALKKMTAPEAEVVRAGRQQTIPTRELVPGDLILLETGNYVPTDVRLVEAFNLKVDEASLTGESVPVRKRADILLDRELPLGDRKNTAYMGTLVTYGRGRAIVTSTGMSTQFGLIAQMVQSFESEPTPLQRKLEQLGKTLGIAALAVCGLVFAVGVLRSLINPTPGVTLLEAALDMFIVAVSLAIAAVPEGLPAVVTICLALGMRRMVQRHALLRQLAAVEALGSATVICSDKTGTLTQNAMTVVQMWVDGLLVDVSGRGYTPEGHFTADATTIDAKQHAGLQLLLQILALCNDAYLEVSGAESSIPSYRLLGDPTEGALVVAAAKGGYWRFDLEKELPRLAEIPFDSERKRMTTIHRRTPAANGIFPGDAPYVALIKGAPDVVLDMCTHFYCEGRVVPLTEADRHSILQVNAALSSQALRVLGGAVKGLAEVPKVEEVAPAMVEQDLIFVGLAGMIDPPRREAGLAVALARQAGIRTVMITGDYPKTAEAVAREIGLLRPNGRLLTGREVDALDDETFAGIVEEVDVFARLSPQHKVRIVKALQSRRHIVSMTGDGVNDAPALKKADIGVAMGITGTDVSKEAAEMVLTDDNFASIVSAIEEGRVIYSNIRKFVFYLLSCNVGEILIIFLATLLGWPLPLTAIHLLVLNLVTDGAPALALGLEKGDPDIMDVPPRDPDEPVVNRPMLWRILVQAIVDTVAVLSAFRLALYLSPGNIAHAQTVAFVTLSVSELFRAYTARSERYNVWRMGFFSNRFMQVAVASSLLILLAIVYVPALDPIFGTTALSVRDWLMILPLTLLPAIAAEITKKVQFGRRHAAGVTLA